MLWFLPHLGRCLYIFFPSVFSIYRSKFLTTCSRNNTSYRIIWLPQRISNHLFSFLLSYSKSLSIRLSQSIQGFVTLRLRYRSTVRTNPSRNSPPTTLHPPILSICRCTCAFTTQPNTFYLLRKSSENLFQRQSLLPFSQNIPWRLADVVILNIHSFIPCLLHHSFPLTTIAHVTTSFVLPS